MKQFSFALFAALLTAFPAAAAPPAPRPKLIVAISVDQFSANLFREYRPHFTGGFERLAGGIAFDRGYQAHGTTETCPGHSTILTGSHPARTGIVANNWIDFDAPRADKSVYCAEDETAPGATSDAYRVSPVHLRVPTLGDRMKAADPEARVVSVALKDRSAVMMGGHKADQLFWFDDGRFTGWGRPAPAPIVDAVNQSIAAALAKPRPAMDLPAFCQAKATPVALAGDRTVGAHRFQREAGDLSGFRASPEADAATLALAAALANQLQLGRGATTDLLAIGLSATDYVGHRYGTEGAEMCLQLLTLDQDLGDFFAVLDKSGIDYAVVLTADHGGLDLPERQRAAGVADAARIDPGLTAEAIGREVADRLSLSGPVFAGDWYVTPSVPAERREEVIALAKELLTARPQVHQVWTAAEVAAHPMPKGRAEQWSMLDRVRASFDPERSGDLIVVLDEYVTPIADPSRGSVATHGSPWDYDRQVPILFWWKSIAPEPRADSAMTVDILPTLASLIALPVPEDEIDGHCLDIVVGPGTNCPR